MRGLFRLRTFVVVLVLLALAGILLANRQLVLSRIGGWLDVGEPPRPVDIVMILNGDLETRPFKAIEMLRRGTAQRVLITSSADTDRPSQLPRVHEMVHRILTCCGVSDEQIEFVDSQCRSTFDEAETLQRYLRKHSDVSVAVVTNDYHTRRARWVFRQVLGDRGAQVQFVSAPTDEFNADNWWRHETGFVAYLSEFPKFVFYQLRYGGGLIWLTVVLAVIAVALLLVRRQTKHIAEPLGE